MKESIVLTVTGIAGIFVGWYSWLNYNTPTVQVDAMTNECLRVISRNGIYDCEHLPKRFKIECVDTYWKRIENREGCDATLKLR
jgi:hypothetical protein